MGTRVLSEMPRLEVLFSTNVFYQAHIVGEGVICIICARGNVWGV